MSDELSQVLSSVLRRVRQRRGLSQAELAELAGMSTEGYGRVERGLVLPRADTLVRLAKALHIRTDVLLGVHGRGVDSRSRRSGLLELRDPYGSDSAELRRVIQLLRGWSPSALRSLSRLLAALERDR